MTRNSDFDATLFAEHAARAIGLEIDPVHFPGVVENVARIRSFAQLFLTFELPEKVEPAPVFEP